MKAYGVELISERHRHRYEFNNSYRDVLEKAGLKLTGVSPDNTLVEIIEVEDHPWFVGVQYHPELKSRPTRPHPLFRDFVAATVKRRTARPDITASLNHPERRTPENKTLGGPE